jgi:hypothetical protein
MTSLANEEDMPQPPNATLNKLNNMGKFVGNKILDFSRKMKRQSAPTAPQASSQFYLNDSETSVDNSEFKESATSEPSSELDPSELADAADSVYVPKLNQKQFQNRQLRIKHIENFTSDSKTMFLII